MKRRYTGSFTVLALLAGCCPGQTPSHTFEIQLPAGLVSETFFARYVLTGQDFGGWVEPRAGVSSYQIDTGRATGIKAILYAPGCAIQTVDVSFSASKSGYSFPCQAIGSVQIAGVLLNPGHLYQRGARLQAKYIARWAQRFLNVDDTVVTSIPVGDSAHLSPDGAFEMHVPDFAQDVLAHPGEIQIWARDNASDVILAQLVATDSRNQRTRMGGLKVQTAYPETTIFTQCGTDSFLLTTRDRFGFASRGAEALNGCSR